MRTLLVALTAAVCGFYAEASVAPSDFRRSIDITVSGYAGESALADFPVLVRLTAANFGALGYGAFNRRSTPATLDLAGGKRVAGRAVDAGCYESVGRPLAVVIR